MLHVLRGAFRQSQKSLRPQIPCPTTMLSGQSLAASTGLQRPHFSWAPLPALNALSFSRIEICPARPALPASSLLGQRSSPFLGGCGVPRTVRTSTAVQAAAETPAAAPKQKSPSAYNLFIKERYSAEKAQNPDVDLKRMSQFWRELPEAEKAEFTSKAAELKVNPTPKPVKIPKEPKTPKRAAAPLNAYTLFVKEAFPGIRQQNPAAKLSDVSPVWKSLSAAEREKFQKRAAEIADNFYKVNPRPVKQKREATGVKKAPSPYNNFVKGNYAAEKGEGGDAKTTFSRVAAKWKTLSDEEKAKWA